MQLLVTPAFPNKAQESRPPTLHVHPFSTLKIVQASGDLANTLLLFALLGVACFHPETGAVATIMPSQSQDTFMMLDDISNRISTLQYAHMILSVVFAPSKSTAFCSVCCFALCTWSLC